MTTVAAQDRAGQEGFSAAKKEKEQNEFQIGSGVESRSVPSHSHQAGAEGLGGFPQSLRPLTTLYRSCASALIICSCKRSRILRGECEAEEHFVRGGEEASDHQPIELGGKGSIYSQHMIHSIICTWSIRIQYSETGSTSVKSEEQNHAIIHLNPLTQCFRDPLLLQDITTGKQ